MQDEKGGDWYADTDDDSALSARNDASFGFDESVNTRAREIEMSSPARYANFEGIKRRNSTPIDPGINLRVI